VFSASFKTGQKIHLIYDEWLARKDNISWVKYNFVESLQSECQVVGV